LPESAYTALDDIRYVWQALFGLANMLCFVLAFDALGLIRNSTSAQAGHASCGLQAIAGAWSSQQITIGRATCAFGAVVTAATAALNIGVEKLANDDATGMATFLQMNCAGCGPLYPPPDSWYQSLGRGLFNVCRYPFQDPVETLSSILMIPVYVVMLTFAVLLVKGMFGTASQHNGSATTFWQLPRLQQVTTSLLAGTILLLPWQFAAGVGLDRTHSIDTPCGFVVDTASADDYMSWMISSTAMRLLPMILLTSAVFLDRFVGFSLVSSATETYAAGKDVTSIHAGAPLLDNSWEATG
jgi:hypothetical protein